MAGRPGAWRYQYHNNQWWYYHPNNTWSSWNGSAWIPYNSAGVGVGVGGVNAGVGVNGGYPYTAGYGGGNGYYGGAPPGGYTYGYNRNPYYGGACVW